MMITPRIYDLHSTDIDLETWSPEDGDLVSFGLTLDIGSGGEGADEFQVLIASAESLVADGPASGKATILVDRDSYSFSAVEELLASIVASCARPTWEGAALALSRHFLWEYEDHQYVD